jgi:transposase
VINYSALMPARALRVIEDLAGDWRRLDERIESLSAEITRLVEHGPACQRLMTVPGIGPLTSSAMVAAIGTGDVFTTWPHFSVFGR